MASPTHIKNYCTQCLSQTNHKVLHNESISDPENDWSREYFMVKCFGCERISFRMETWDYWSGDVNSYGDVDSYGLSSVNTFPKGLENRSELQDSSMLPRNIQIIYQETIEAMKNDCFLLAGVGFRAIIESICIDNNIKGKDLANKIDKIQTKGLITIKEAARMHSVRFLGNDAVHEMTVPLKKSLLITLDIVEQLLRNIYIIDKKIEGNLDSIISNFQDFGEIILKKISKLNLNDEVTLKAILGRDFRRVQAKFDEFERELIESINSGQYKFLNLGTKSQNGSGKIEQNFVIAQLPDIFHDFI